MDNIKLKIKKLPELPGVYFFKDKYNNIIYIGKSKCLKKRVKQYFYKSKNDSTKIQKLKFNIFDLEYIITDTELEALVLESRMIKKYKPKYNSLLKNFKAYPYIKITNEDYPMITSAYKIKDDNALYFGPYNKKRLVYEIVKYINELFPIRKCGIKIKSETCLYYHLGKCLAPCNKSNYVKEEYQEMINEIIDILKGNGEYLLKELNAKMTYHSKSLNYEKAADYRNKINKFEILIYKQRIITKALSEEELIIIEKTIKENIKIYYIRGGRILDTFILYKEEKIDKLKLKTFLIPLLTKLKTHNKILPQEEIDEAQIIESWVNHNEIQYIEIEESMDINDLIKLLHSKILQTSKGEDKPVSI
ncbi:GIY-YIG nuclease family protein [Senegalia sp. (in: firmicutes)]|uniref:GIY-YIG nuclease family protein n=3 Tax=Senegalia sp. (in: firmicutes) TaxID=1924098 RepID=UPI003F97D714